MTKHRGWIALDAAADWPVTRRRKAWAALGGRSSSSLSARFGREASPEHDTTVSDAIRQLGRGRRMVGIITHVQELTAVLPARIEVSRGPDGSKIKAIPEA